MITHIWTVICARSLIDAETHNLSLLDVLEELQVPASIFEGDEKRLPLRFEVVTSWGRQRPQQATRGNGRLKLLDPAGKMVEQQQFQIDLSEFARSRTRVRAPGLALTKPGVYTFQVELQQENLQQWHEVARVPLDIKVAAPSAS